MRVFLDNGVPAGVGDLLRSKGHEVLEADQLLLKSVQDHVIYMHAVSQGADLVVTCNNGRTPDARAGGFVRQVEDHLGVREKNLPVPVYGLTRSDTGNYWNKIELRWPVHERQIEHYARQIENTNHGDRRARAMELLADLLEARQERERQRERDKDLEIER